MINNAIIKQIILDTISIKFGYVVDAKYKYNKSIFISAFRKSPVSEIINVEAQVTVISSKEPVRWKFDLPIRRTGNYDLNIDEFHDEELIFDTISDYYSKFNHYPDKYRYSLIGLEIISFLPDIPLIHFIKLYDQITAVIGKNEKYIDYDYIRIADCNDKKSVAFYNRLKANSCCKPYDEIVQMTPEISYMFGFNYSHGKY